MRPTDEIQLIFLQEICDNIASEDIADPSLGLPPALHTRVRVRPEQVTKQSSIRNISRPDNRINLLGRQQIGRESSMHAEDLLFHEGGHRHAVEAIDEGLPQFGRVAGFAYTWTIIYIRRRSRRCG